MKFDFCHTTEVGHFNCSYYPLGILISHCTQHDLKGFVGDLDVRQYESCLILISQIVASFLEQEIATNIFRDSFLPNSELVGNLISNHLVIHLCIKRIHSKLWAVVILCRNI